jgi:hypothetical protein
LRAKQKQKPRKRGGGGNTFYLTSLSINCGGKAVNYKKAAAKWTFNMPAGNVVINGTFSDTPAESNELAVLDVNVSCSITPELLADQSEYTAIIPHIFPTDPYQKFSIIATPKDPEAVISINSESPYTGDEFPLTEGKTDYTITVSREGLDPKTYTFTVDYEPDLSLKSITLTSDGYDPHPVAVLDGQTITIPYGAVTITASPNVEGVTLSASASGVGTFYTGEAANTWTLTYPSNLAATYAVDSTVTIKSTKSDYEKDFTLNFQKIVDPDWPLTYWATSNEGNGVSIIKENDVYYEIHTFTVGGTLTVTEIPDDGLTARVLVVAGGGGGGYRAISDIGGGGGGGGVGYSESVSLAVKDYTVVVGSGGSTSTKGGDSSFDSITVEGGGKGGNATNSGDVTEAQNGGSGGSGGGGGAAGGNKFGTGGSANPHASVDGYKFYGSNGGSGGMTYGGNGGSAGFSNNISGVDKEYGKGGPGNASTTPANGTGNGGGGDSSSHDGSSGIVIVRFPARPNSTSIE